MLAQNFKTPADLKISDAEFEALVKVLGMLERGEIVHGDRWQSGEESASLQTFWYSTQFHKEECGTVACIGGWVAIVAGFSNPKKYVDNCHLHSHPLSPLFWDDEAMCSVPTPAQAAIAVRTYLTTGDPNWAEALVE